MCTAVLITPALPKPTSAEGRSRSSTEQAESPLASSAMDSAAAARADDFRLLKGLSLWDVRSATGLPLNAGTDASIIVWPKTLAANGKRKLCARVQECGGKMVCAVRSWRVCS